jgi:phospholipid-binding lipoprotein MlaA
MDYDPWERFNEKTFWFNHDVLDRYALKPVATVWSKIPDPMRQGLANAFHNLAMPDRLVNEVFQARFQEAGSEVARFLLNTTVGVAGFVDVASRAGLQESDADAGQTLGVYGAGAGPYLVLPLLPPLTVRDGIGYAVDSLLDPLSWFVTPFGADFGRAAAKTVNDRAANLKLYQDVEGASLDLYAAVRNGYLQRRQKSIEDAIRQRDKELESEELFFAQFFGDFDQRALAQGINADEGARTAENQGPIRP